MGSALNVKLKLLNVRLFLLCNVCNGSSQSVDDDGDYEHQQLPGNDNNDVISDVITGKLMTCTGLVEMPNYLPPGETLGLIDSTAS